jgi:hypothetical protein
VLCLIAIDALLREQVQSELFWESIGSRIRGSLKNFSRAPKTYKDELTFEKVLEL